MGQISLEAAEDLLSKLLSGRIPLSLVFQSASGARVILSGFLDCKTVAGGLIFLGSGQPVDVRRGFLRVPTFRRDCRCAYKEKRELSEDERKDLPDSEGDSVLMIQFPDFRETLFLFSTLLI